MDWPDIFVTRGTGLETPWINISDAVFDHAKRRPDSLALIDGGKRLSYGEVAEFTGKASVYLKTLGIRPKDRVGISLTNSAEHVILSLAVMRVGATLVELPAELTAEEMAARVQKFGITASFADAGGTASPASVSLRIRRRWLEDIAPLTGDVRFDGPADEMRMIVVSSGSTGIPKGIVTTQRQRILRSATYQSLFGTAWSPESPGILLQPAPANMSLFGQFLTIQLLLGGPVVLLPKFSQAVDLAQAVASWEGTICPVVPAMARGFAACADGTRILFPAMRAMVCSGLPLAGHEKLAVLTKVTPNFHEVYGSGGFGAFSHLGPAEMAAHPNSVGRPVTVPGNEVQIAGADGQKAAPGVEGRLRARGVNASIGFFNAEDNARGAETFAGDWYYPGDVMQADEAGYFYLRGRADDAILAGPLTIYPPEIEDVLMRHPGVAEAVVVPRPNETGGVDLIGFIVARPGLSHEDVTAHCITNLPPVKRPKAVYYLDAIPRTGNGKIDRPAVKDAALRLAAQV